MLEVVGGKIPADHKVTEEPIDKLFKVIAVGSQMTDVYNSEHASLLLPLESC